MSKSATRILASILVGFVAGYAVKSIQSVRQTEAIPENYVDLSHASEEFRKQIEDPDYQRFISNVKITTRKTVTINGENAELAKLNLPPGTPSFPVSPLLAPEASARWPILNDETLQSALDAHKSEWVLINLWASWCAPCVAELPDMDAAFPKYKDISVHLFTINADVTRNDDEDKVTEVFQKRDVKNLMPLRADGPDVRELVEAFGMSMESSSLPSNILYAPGGEPVAFFSGGAAGNKAHWNSPIALQVLTKIIEHN